MNNADTLQGYIQMFENLSETNLSEQLAPFFTPNAAFKDPFNAIHGTDNIVVIFEHMYETLHHARFEVHHSALNGDIAYLHWTMYAQRTASSEPFEITGLTQLHFENGLVSAHIDFWDSAQVWHKIPGLRWLLKKLGNKLAVPEQRLKG